ncbi:hypothetical protein ACLVWU_04220 [Bdellovibrio sp. HCB290]|uniref:hypothetical protein n=1 Tax=Bdellovibrio sp. HCB290 TaxID=3394356 RepID=UPI0039B69F3B
MKLKYLVSAIAICASSTAFAKSGAQQFVSNYAKLPKSYDAVQFRGQAKDEFEVCTLLVTAGYLNDGMKYMQLANHLGEATFVNFDSNKNYTGNVIKISQRDEEVDEFGNHYPVVYSLKLQVDDKGEPVRAKGKIDRRFPYSDTEISCNFSSKTAPIKTSGQY